MDYNLDASCRLDYHPKALQKRADCNKSLAVTQIVTRACRESPQVFDGVFLFVLVMSIVTCLAPTLLQKAPLILMALLAVAKWIADFYLFVALILFAGSAWRRESGNNAAIWKKLHWKLVTKVGGLSFCIAVMLLFTPIFVFVIVSHYLSLIQALALLVFSAIPGMIFAVNRAVAVCSLAFEGLSIKNAMKNSKVLMTSEKWYVLRSPVMRLMGVLLIVIGIGIVSWLLLHIIARLSLSLPGLLELIISFLCLLASYLILALQVTIFVGFYFELKKNNATG